MEWWKGDGESRVQWGYLFCEHKMSYNYKTFNNYQMDNFDWQLNYII